MEHIYDMLARHEGLRLHPYECSEGKITIGYGRNLEDSGITEGEARILLHHDVDRVTSHLVLTYPWFRGLSTSRQTVLQNMCFQLGERGLSGFKNMLSALERRKWSLAADEMLNSRWASQTPERANELAELMRKG